MNEDILSGASSFEVIAVSVLLVLAAAVAGAALIRQIPYPSKPGGPVLLSMLVGFSLIMYRVVFEPNLVDDENTWHRRSLMVADYIIGHGPLYQSDLSAGKEGYAWLIGSLYSTGARSPIVPIVLGVVLLTLLVPLTGALAGLVGRDLDLPEAVGSRAVRTAMVFMAICPTIAFWAPRLLREVLVMFLVALAALFFLKLLAHRGVRWLLPLAVVVITLTTIRAQVGIGLAAGFVMSAIVVWTLRFRSRLMRAIVITPAFAGILVWTWTYVNSTTDLSLANTAYRNVALARATSAFSEGNTLRGASSYADIVMFNLPRVAFGPFPQELSLSPVMLLAAVSNVFWLLCVVGALMLFVSRRKVAMLSERAQGKPWRSAVALLVVVLTLVAIVSISAGNYGLVARMRLMPLALLVPLAATGLAVMRTKVTTRIRPERPLSRMP